MTRYSSGPVRSALGEGHHDPHGADARAPTTPRGYSLGDWGPVDVPGVRPGAPVFTIEPDMDFESWAFLDGVQYVEEDGNYKTQYQRNPQD